jgi:thiol-disulfide isomerase/thioredoxin
MKNSQKKLFTIKHKEVSMKPIALTACILFTIFSVSLKGAEQMEVSFFKGTVEGARDKARKESKLYFIEFYAKWCDPCKWMDEYTFKNTALSDYIDKNYIPVKVDVENLDGFVWKQKYKVQYLPTIVVLNNNGTMVGKYEKSMAASDLMVILKNHRAAPMETGSLASDPGKNLPGTSVMPVKTTTESEAKPAFVSVRREPGLPKASEVTSRKPESPANLTNNPGTQNSKPVKASTAAKPMTTDPSKSLSVPFRVQVGVYSDATNMMSEVNKLRKAYTQSVQVFNIKNKETNAVTYRITLGQFATREEASGFAQELKTKGLAGVVKHISELEPKK